MLEFLHGRARRGADAGLKPTHTDPVPPSTLQSAGGDSRLGRGLAAEALAADYLRAQGLAILVRNFRCRCGELDLLCLDAEILVIVEVRQRQGSDFGGALASVTWRKQRRIMRATQVFLQREARWRSHLLRFDVIALQGSPEGDHEILWVKDAFRGA